MINILIAILMFAILIAVHEFGHFAAAKMSGVQVNEFSIGMGPVIFQKQKGETMYSLRWIPMGGYCAMEGEDDESNNPRSFQRAKTWQKLFILAAGAFMNLVLGFVILFTIITAATDYNLLEMPTISGFIEGYDNVDCGLLPDDIVYEVNGRPIYTFNNLVQFLNRAGDVIDFVVVRDGEKLTLNNVDLPRQLKEDVDGNMTNLRGIALGAVTFERTFGNIIKFTWYNTLDFVRLIYMNLLDLISGALSPKDMSGPVGIVDSIAQVGELSDSTATAALNISYFAALITVNLGIMNLLPLPALDGGRIFFIIANSIIYAFTKKNVPLKYEAYFHGAGMVLLLLMMAFVTVGDISRIISR